MLSNLTTKAYISVTEGIRRFKENQQGVTAIEYGFIENLKTKFNQLTDTLKNTNGLSKASK